MRLPAELICSPHIGLLEEAFRTNVSVARCVVTGLKGDCLCDLARILRARPKRLWLTLQDPKLESLSALTQDAKPRISHLTLRGQLSYGNLPALLDAFASLRGITLRGLTSPLGPGGLQALMLGVRSTGIADLELLGARIDDQGAINLANALQGHLWLRRLALRHNRIAPEGARALAFLIRTSCLTSLDLANNQVGEKGAEAFADDLATSRLYLLGLASNKIAIAGARKLAAALQSSRLEFLDLSHNRIGNRGAAAIFDALPSSRLVSLRLRDNGLDSAATLVLVENLKRNPTQRIHFTHTHEVLIGAGVSRELFACFRILSLRHSRDFVSLVLRCNATERHYAIVFSRSWGCSSCFQ
ncbi:hypothetical protein EBZ37_11370 [bacterium]|nr:hypothetical protein [bacterium]